LKRPKVDVLAAGQKMGQQSCKIPVALSAAITKGGFRRQN
jgi:hypothetical protein